MADSTVPYFRNDVGVKQVAVGARELMCTGASAPHDHPHIFLDMGDGDEIICPYCSTLFRHRNDLAVHAAEPAECAYQPGETV